MHGVISLVEKAEKAITRKNVKYSTLSQQMTTVFIIFMFDMFQIWSLGSCKMGCTSSGTYNL